MNYADDTNVLISGNSLESTVSACKTAFKEISKWFESNQLVLNKNKTKAILFRTRQSCLQISDDFTLSISRDTQLPLVSDCGFLGMEIDEFLEWQTHINRLCTKLNKVNFAFKTLAKYMDIETLRIIYCANFESLLRYGVIFWGKSSNVHKVFVIQKRTIRFIKRLKYSESCRGQFRGLNIMTVYGLYIYECLISCFRNKETFRNLSSLYYDTRTANIAYPAHRLTVTEKSPHYMSIRVFNKLPYNVKTINGFVNFKKCIKKLLVELEPYSLQEYFEM